MYCHYINASDYLRVRKPKDITFLLFVCLLFLCICLVCFSSSTSSFLFISHLPCSFFRHLPRLFFSYLIYLVRFSSSTSSFLFISHLPCSFLFIYFFLSYRLTGYKAPTYLLPFSFFSYFIYLVCLFVSLYLPCSFFCYLSVLFSSLQLPDFIFHVLSTVFVSLHLPDCFFPRVALHLPSFSTSTSFVFSYVCFVFLSNLHLLFLVRLFCVSFYIYFFCF